MNRLKTFIIYFFLERGDYLTTHFLNPCGCKAEVVVTRYSKLTTFFETDYFSVIEFDFWRLF